MGMARTAHSAGAAIRSPVLEVPVSSPAENKALIEGFWNDLYVVRDWDKVASYFDDESHYEDVPAPDDGADGAANIVKRLRIGLEPIDRFDHETHRVAAEGDVVMVEHTETWHFRTGEAVKNPFVSVIEVRDGKIKLWRDHWDLQTLLGAAPQWWLDEIMSHTAEDFS